MQATTSGIFPAAIAAADALGCDKACIGEDNGDIVVGKDVGTGPGRNLQVRVWSRARFFPLRVRLIP